MTARVNVLVRVDLDDLIFMDVDGFEALVEEAVGGEGCISAWTAEVETVENNTSLVIRVQGDWE